MWWTITRYPNFQFALCNDYDVGIHWWNVALCGDYGLLELVGRMFKPSKIVKVGVLVF
jgi:hypothetical protein